MQRSAIWHVVYAGMLLFHYIASVNLDNKCAALLEMRCARPETASSPAFHDLAQRVCLTVAHYAPRYLERGQIPADEAERASAAAKLEAIRRGIPKDELSAYTAKLAQAALNARCLLSLPLAEPLPEAHDHASISAIATLSATAATAPESAPTASASLPTVAQALEVFATINGPVKVERFFRMSVDD